MTLSLREAVEADCLLIHEWANDPEARRVSFSTEPIPLSTHRAWFREKLADPRCQLYVALLDGVPVGQLRFDGEIVSISLRPDRRGQGLGPKILALGIARSGLSRVEAFIKPDNRASIRAFEKAGFSGPEPVVFRGHEALKMVFEKHQVS